MASFPSRIFFLVASCSPKKSSLELEKNEYDVMLPRRVVLLYFYRKYSSVYETISGLTRIIQNEINLLSSARFLIADQGTADHETTEVMKKIIKETSRMRIRKPSNQDNISH